MAAISKTRFLDLIRCDWYSILEYEMKRKDKRNIDDLESLFEEEISYKRKGVLDRMFYEMSLEDIVEFNKDTEDVFANEYVEIELLAAKAAKAQFIEGEEPVEVKYGQTINSQKHFESSYKDYDFHCFLDFYLELEDEIIVVEVKSSTNSSLLEDDPDKSLFIKSPDGIFRYYKEFGLTRNRAQTLILDRTSSYSMAKKIYDLTYQRFVIENYKKENPSFKKPIRYFLGLLNSEYEFDGTYDKAGNPIYDNSIIVFYDMTPVTDIVLNQVYNDADKVVRRLNATYEEKVNFLDPKKVPLSRECQRNETRECPFYNIHCSKIANIPEKHSVFEYIDNHYGFHISPTIKAEKMADRISIYDKIREGKSSMLDMDREELLYPKQKCQRDVVETNKKYVNKKGIKYAFDMLEYPIYHLDFETFASPLPRFYGEHCYDQSVFQFSLHIEREPGVCDKDKDHVEYLIDDATVDERKELMDLLMASIDESKGCILAYNYGFEKARLNDLARIFPKYQNKVIKLCDNAKDLIHFFKGKSKMFPKKITPYSILYYDEDFYGSYSIKKVLPSLSPDLTYENMEVGNGTEAVAAFAKLQYMLPEKKKKLQQDLLKYCKQDTWAMVVLLNELRKEIA